MKGILIAFEGLDGSGQSTQSSLLANYLLSKGFKVVQTKEPTSGLIGGIIKAALRNEWNVGDQALQLLFAADRAHHLEKEIIPAIEKGKIVITDRYFFSSIAFGKASGLSKEWLKSINSKFPLPNVTIFIDTSVDECLRRIKKSRFERELFENKERLEQTRKNFLELSNEYENFYVVDGNKSIEEVHEQIKKIVDNLLKELL